MKKKKTAVRQSLNENRKTKEKMKRCRDMKMNDCEG